MQVLLTEELQGSLRTLKAAPMLARDRYKRCSPSPSAPPSGPVLFTRCARTILTKRFRGHPACIRVCLAKTDCS